ncbi:MULTISPECIES: bacterioferritin-associated ferredoxin [Rhodococcus]|jgi:bacterioferritin-associated ferredoxin|uniref:Bacterioferritin-associated ferredoxin n=1 Tax=Rhodococcus oxybenzonivorans TaxID=1990687 RepID=A0AAE4UXA2_9NOCA|nr:MULTISPECIES: (2Fe-2S)-binding protein [Rhodococcus]MDV7243026.1 (2Fe-2S)-binding protein [Rhodococcus oxybenzonivorans]MDV7264430.1 (2Fe-2S)-binding protein [Rhodococcus oxybenzonivorans]MDV7275430.1 (2Fe-2S)-binding protein [Rhodococcus oxybenzonivorans]MDV7334715.1 (2Fe-2S)-binding protein [Rhodococcus oxybenzonivorans]MDV7344869.1 (2Fe-2S)-binding protein [Rhodococcus oxybenzonivorans]
MFVCICKAVTETEVHEHVHDGADSADAIGERCGAGWGCGTCVNRLEEILCAYAERNRTAA